MAYAIILKNSWDQKASIDAVLRTPNYIEKTFKVNLDEADADKFANVEDTFECGCCWYEYEVAEAVQVGACGHILCSDCF